jgi:hypothetical protein
MAAGADSHAVRHAEVPRWAMLSVTWMNSLGSGVLWSGVPFVTEREYGFTQGENLALALAEAALYVAVALAAGPVLRRLSAAGRCTPRGWLAGIFVLQAGTSLLALAGSTGVIVAACVLSAAGAAMWPVMESYVSSGRHGGSMRRSIAVFNVTWMSATGVALLVMAPLVASGMAAWSLVGMVPVSAASMVVLRWFPASPAPHPPEHAHTHIAPQYPYLLRATRFVMPTSYVFISVIGPVLPFLLLDLGLEDGWKTPLASAWMFARMGTVLLMGLASFWHGRWATLAVGLALLAGGFALTAFAGSAPAMLAGLVAFGAGHGILYFASLYYAMAVGGAEVDAGGTFEALIGAGYVVGPLAGLAAGDTHGGLVAATAAAGALGLLPALMPYLAWRRKAAEAALAAAR